MESRFADIPVDKFVALLDKFGFRLRSKDLTHKYFYLLDFNKVDAPKRKGAPEFALKSCIYKKR